MHVGHPALHPGILTPSLGQHNVRHPMTLQRDVAESYWRAECARDIDAILSHYAPDGHFSAPGWDLHGHDEIRQYYEQSAARFPGLEVTVVGDFADGDIGAVEWDAYLIDADGVGYPIKGVNIISLSGGVFADVRAYFDTSLLPSE